MKVVYPVIFSRTGEDSTYLVEIPDIGGLTQGYGLDEAIEMARDYIGGYCYPLKNDDIPTPTELGSVDLKKGQFVEDSDLSFVSLVDADIDLYRRRMNKKSVRRNVSIPAWLDQAAEEEGINVSRVLQEALMEKLNV